MKRALLFGLLVAGTACAPNPAVDLEVRYTGISVADLHVRVTSPGLNPSRWYFENPRNDDNGTMNFVDGDVLLRESIPFDALEEDQPGWDVSAWIDLQGDEEFICATEPLNAIDCAPDLQDKQTRFRFTLLASGPTAVDVVITD